MLERSCYNSYFACLLVANSSHTYSVHTCECCSLLTVATPGAGAVDRGAVFSNLLELQQQTLNSLNDSQRAAVVNFITAPNDSLHVVQVNTRTHTHTHTQTHCSSINLYRTAVPACMSCAVTVSVFEEVQQHTSLCISCSSLVSVSTCN
jgi:hypothetical protein